VPNSSVTVPEEGCPRRDQLNDSAQLPDFHLRVIGVLKLEEDNVVQLQVSAGGHLLGGFSTNRTFPVSCDEGAGLRLIIGIIISIISLGVGSTPGWSRRRLWMNVT